MQEGTPRVRMRFLKQTCVLNFFKCWKTWQRWPPYGALRVLPGELAKYPMVLPSQRENKDGSSTLKTKMSANRIPSCMASASRSPLSFGVHLSPCPPWLPQTVSYHCGNNCSKTMKTRVDPEFLKIQILRSSWLSA